MVMSFTCSAYLNVPLPCAHAEVPASPSASATEAANVVIHFFISALPA